MLNRNGKLYTVNIRPPRWHEKEKPCKFWIGKQSREWAQYKADTIFHYTGKPRFHYKDADLVFPPLECMGTEIGTPVLLETPKMRRAYIESIAGEAFTVHRKEFIRQVMGVMKSAAFILQGQRLLNSTEEAAVVMPGEEAVAVMSREEAAAPREEETATPREVEVAVLSEGVVENEEDDDNYEDTYQLEEDSMSIQALRDIQFSAPLFSDKSGTLYPTVELHVLGSDTDTVRVLDSMNAYAPSFEINPNISGKKILQSVGQSFGWMNFSMKDCPETLEKGQQCSLICSCGCGVVLLNVLRSKAFRCFFCSVQSNLSLDLRGRFLRCKLLGWFVPLSGYYYCR